MPRRLIPAGEFRDFAKDATTGEILDADQNPIAIMRDMLASLDPDQDFESDSRQISYIFSTQEVARDGHTVRTEGFELTGFNSNPVFLWAHDSGEPPIGKVVDLARASGVMRGVVEYVERDLYPFGDMIFRMVKKRFLNATSISWKPLEWKFSTDRARPNGIDFIRQDLLEISQVPVPALATALATARGAGIDTAPMFAWAEKVLDGGGKIVLPRAEVERLRTAAKMPTAKKRAAGTEVVIDQPKKKRAFSRGLYEVADLASNLLWLNWIADFAEWEKEIEGDESDVPGRLKDVVNQLGAILVDMTIEEVAELLGIEGDDTGVVTVAVIEQNAKTPAQRAVLALANFARSVNAQDARKFVVNADRPITAEQAKNIKRQVQGFLSAAQTEVLVLDKGLTLQEVTRENGMPLPALIEQRVRAGRVLSASNEESLRNGIAMIQSVVDQVAAQADPETAVVEVSDTEEQRAQTEQRHRAARAMALAGNAP